MSGLRAAAALLLACAGAAAAAQTPAPGSRGFALQTYEPPPAGDRFFSVPDTGVPGHLAPAAAMVLSWAREPLVLQIDGVTVPGGRLVHRQFWGFLQGSLGLGDRLLLDVALPVALFQSGSRPIAALPEVSAVALGDVKVGVRTPLPRLGPLDLAAAVDLWIPTGSEEAFSSDGAVRVQPRLVASGSAGPLEYGGTLGYLHRESSDRVLTSTGPALSFSAAGAWRVGPWRFGPELFGRYQFDGAATSPVEALLGGHWRRGAIDAGLALSTGLDRSPGAAPLRVLAQVSWRPPARPAGLSAEALARLAAERAAAEQAAADLVAAERLAAAQASDERAAADRAAAGQAAADRASTDRLAAERAEAERLAAERARATADRDGDGIPDVSDACPDQQGQTHVEAARHGCPAPVPVLVKVTRERIEILQAVQFETSRDVIRPESEALLTEVAQVLGGHPELVKVMVEGHTDAQGAKDFNMTLSGKRAEAVKRWLVEMGGVDAARLTAEGYGPARPIDTNTTTEGRARNRRVEFRIVEQR